MVKGSVTKKRLRSKQKVWNFENCTFSRFIQRVTLSFFDHHFVPISSGVGVILLFHIMISLLFLYATAGLWEFYAA